MTRPQYAVQLLAGLALVAAGVHLLHGLATLPEHPGSGGLDAGRRFALSFAWLNLAAGVLTALVAMFFRTVGGVVVLVLGAVGVLVPVAMFDPAPDHLLIGLRDVVVQASALSGAACLLATVAIVARVTRWRRPAPLPRIG
jgi:hypothetical protein